MAVGEECGHRHGRGDPADRPHRRAANGEPVRSRHGAGSCHDSADREIKHALADSPRRGSGHHDPADAIVRPGQCQHASGGRDQHDGRRQRDRGKQASGAACPRPCGQHRAGHGDGGRHDWSRDGHRSLAKWLHVADSATCRMDHDRSCRHPVCWLAFASGLQRPARGAAQQHNPQHDHPGEPDERAQIQLGRAGARHDVHSADHDADPGCPPRQPSARQARPADGQRTDTGRPGGDQVGELADHVEPGDRVRPEPVGGRVVGREGAGVRADERHRRGSRAGGKDQGRGPASSLGPAAQQAGDERERGQQEQRCRGDQDGARVHLSGWDAGIEARDRCGRGPEGRRALQRVPGQEQDDVGDAECARDAPQTFHGGVPSIKVIRVTPGSAPPFPASRVRVPTTFGKLRPELRRKWCGY